LSFWDFRDAAGKEPRGVSLFVQKALDMKKTHIVSMVALSLVLGGMAAQPFVSHVAYAADAKKQFTNKEVATPAAAAQGLMGQKKFKEAIEQLEKANAVAKKTPYETYVVNLLLLQSYSAVQDTNNAVKAFEAASATGEMEPANAAAFTKALMANFYAAKNYPKTIEYAQRVLKDSPNDLDTLSLVAQANYLQNNFKGAADSSRALIKATQSAGKPPSEQSLSVLMSAEFRQQNDAGVISALEQLVALYPKEDYWRNLIELNQKALRTAPAKTGLDIALIKSHLGLLKPEDYVDTAQLAIQQGLPGTAKALMESGMKAGVLGQGAGKDREARLLTMATTQATTDQAGLTKGVADASTQKTGDALINLGESYASYGQYDKAIETIQAGIAKTPADMDDAKLRLGIVYIQSGKRQQGLDAFKGITAGTPSAQVAKLWSLASGAKKAA